MRILLIEDEDKAARFVTLGLKADGFTVDRVADGNAGMEMATTTSYDMLIVGLMLPGAHGAEFIKRLRGANPLVPIIILSACDSVNNKIDNFGAGADDYLTKPFAFAELLVRIKALLRRSAVSPSNVVRIGNLEIDRVTHQVKRNGVFIRLTSKEYGLLEYLALNAGRTFSRTMIIERVWDEGFEGFTNIVDVYIRHLREKIDDPFPEKLIHTKRNMGYCLSDAQEEQ